MRLQLDVRLQGGHYTGWLSRPDDAQSVAFWGILELVAALEQLLPADVRGPASDAQQELPSP